MSLNNKLWIAIISIMATAFIGTFVISTLSAQKYFSEQLHVKNVDNATSLALSMSHTQKDPIYIELMLSAQFDAGHYKLIRLTGPTGSIKVERLQTETTDKVPQWFIKLIPLSAEPGIAQVQDQWKLYGTLTVESHADYAYIELWGSTLRLSGWFLVAALLTGLLGTSMLNVILRPLNAVVEQAEAIGEQRFVTTPEPSTSEFRRLVRVMNTLSGRVRKMLQEESKRVDELRRLAQLDPVSGIYKRESLLSALDARLGDEHGEYVSGMLVILRVQNLATLNSRLGRQATDQLIHRIGTGLQNIAEQHSGWIAGRLNGTDFAVITPYVSDAMSTCERIRASSLDAWQQCTGSKDDFIIHVGACYFGLGETSGSILSRADGALATAESQGALHIESGIQDNSLDLPTSLTHWQTVLDNSLQPENLKLNRYPVISASGILLHYEAPAKLKVGSDWLPAGKFVPWAIRLSMMAQLDRLVFDQAVDAIKQNKDVLSINLSMDAIRNIGFQDHMIRRLQEPRVIASRLLLEVNEYDAINHQPEYRTFCLALKPTGCKIGLKHVGQRFSHIGELHDVGLDYLKVDASIVKDIDRNLGNQAFLRGVCVVAHAIGIHAIAGGVNNQSEIDCLRKLGIDGMTGPGIKPD